MTQKIDISTASIVRFILILLGLWFVFLIRDVIALVFVVLVLVAGLEPTIGRLSKYLTRPGATVLVFVIIFAVLSLFAYILVPPLTSQIKQFSMHLPEYVSSVSNGSQGQTLQNIASLVHNNIDSIVAQFGNVGDIVINRTIGVIDGLVAVVTIIVLTFYLLVGENSIKSMYRGFLPHGVYELLADTTQKIADKLGSWIRGQLVLMVAFGVLTFIGLTIVRTPYALALATMAGLLEIIPVIGPWVTALVATLIGLTISPITGALTLIVCIIVQQLEGHILIPKIMSQAVGLNPVVVIISLLIGATLYGVMGTLLAVPVAAIIGVIVEDWSLIIETFSKLT